MGWTAGTSVLRRSNVYVSGVTGRAFTNISKIDLIKVYNKVIEMFICLCCSFYQKISSSKLETASYTLFNATE